MSDVQFQQSHSLGLDKARELAQRWVEGAGAKMGLTCKTEQGADKDVVSFERSGVNGTMVVTGESFNVVTWNIGYAGLDREMDFFYDGGTRVRPARAALFWVRRNVWGWAAMSSSPTRRR